MGGKGVRIRLEGERYKMLGHEYYGSADVVSAVRCTENHTRGPWGV